MTEPSSPRPSCLSRTPGRFGHARGGVSSRCGWLWVALALLAGQAQAQTQAQPAPIEPNVPTEPTAPTEPAPSEAPEHASRWTLSFEPIVWYAAASGDFRIGRNSGGVPGGPGDDVDLGFLEADDPRLSLGGEAHWRDGPWTATLGGFAMSVDAEAPYTGLSAAAGSLTVDPGETFRTDLDVWSLEASAGYRVFERSWDGAWSGPDHAGGDAGRVPFRVRADMLAGVRVFDVDVEFSELDGAGDVLDTAGGHRTFVHPLLGGKVSLAFDERFSIDAQGSVGYLPELDGKTGFAWDIFLGFAWRPWDHVGGQIGYRQLAFTLEDRTDGAEFEWGGALAGLYAGLVIEF